MANATDPEPSLHKPSAQHHQTSPDEMPVQPSLEVSDGYFKSRFFIGTVIAAGFGMIGVRNPIMTV